MAAARDVTPSLANADVRWFLTLDSVSHSRWPMSALDSCMTTMASTCFSRADRLGRRSTA